MIHEGSSSRNLASAAASQGPVALDSFVVILVIFLFRRAPAECLVDDRP